MPFDNRPFHNPNGPSEAVKRQELFRRLYEVWQCLRLISTRIAGLCQCAGSRSIVIRHNMSVLYLKGGIHDCRKAEPQLLKTTTTDNQIGRHLVFSQVDSKKGMENG